MGRDPQLQHFIDVLATAIRQRLDAGSAEEGVARQIFDALKVPGTAASNVSRETPPAHRYLGEALAIGKAGPADIAAVADAFEQLEPRLSWYRRKNAEMAGQKFMDGHANATVIGQAGIGQAGIGQAGIGQAGLEHRSDVQIGVSLMAPHIQYVDHQHPPAEVYLVMTPGNWRQEQHSWHEPGIGGIVYNTPNIVHAMRSGDQPLFAVWCLLAE